MCLPSFCSKSERYINVSALIERNLKHWVVDIGFSHFFKKCSIMNCERCINSAHGRKMLPSEEIQKTLLYVAGTKIGKSLQTGIMI